MEAHIGLCVARTTYGSIDDITTNAFSSFKPTHTTSVDTHNTLVSTTAKSADNRDATEVEFQISASAYRDSFLSSYSNGDPATGLPTTHRVMWKDKFGQTVECTYNLGSADYLPSAPSMQSRLEHYRGVADTSGKEDGQVCDSTYQHETSVARTPTYAPQYPNWNSNYVDQVEDSRQATFSQVPPHCTTDQEHIPTQQPTAYSQPVPLSLASTLHPSHQDYTQDASQSFRPLAYQPSSPSYTPQINTQEHAVPSANASTVSTFSPTHLFDGIYTQPLTEEQSSVVGQMYSGLSSLSHLRWKLIRFVDGNRFHEDLAIEHSAKSLREFVEYDEEHGVQKSAFKSWDKNFASNHTR